MKPYELTGEDIKKLWLENEVEFGFRSAQPSDFMPEQIELCKKVERLTRKKLVEWLRNG